MLQCHCGMSDRQMGHLQTLSYMVILLNKFICKLVNVRQTKPTSQLKSHFLFCTLTSNLLQQQTILSCCLWVSLVDWSRLSSHTGPAIHLGNLSTPVTRHSNKCQGPPLLVYLQTCYFLFRDIKHPFSLDTGIKISHNLEERKDFQV